MKWLVVLILALPLAQCQYWWLLPGVDSPKKDIRNAGTTDIKQLQQICGNTSGCVGFNSNGWLKNDVSGSNLVAAPCDLYLAQGDPQPYQKIWPLPASYSTGTQQLSVDPSTFTFFAKQSSQDLAAAFARYRRIIFTHSLRPRTDGISLTALPSLVVDVADLNAPLQNGVDESYQLTVPADGTNASLTTKTVYGAYRGLETFSQMIRYDFIAHGYVLVAAPWSVNDQPRFPHRGVLFDTARHFQPLSSIFRLIEAMAFAKFNVLHWHAVDSQSFPLEVVSYPHLWDGAYSADERYTQQDMMEVVQFAKERGIRVMIEFDIPGHAAAWCRGYPAICPSTTCTEPLNPASDQTFQVIEGVFKEMTGGSARSGIFFEDMFHLGGDEVNYRCWDKSPDIQKWQQQKGLNDETTYMYFISQSHSIVEKFGRSPVGWEEVFNHFGSKLDNNTIVHVWLDKATLKKVVSAGYRALLSDNDFWYLDHLDQSWTTMYLNEPLYNITDPTQQKLVLGGEACMWGETVDASDLEATVWPRAAAVAERLWSPASVNNPGLALPRIEYFRCLLNRRGIGAAPVNNAVARDAPPGPGGCYTQ